MPALNEFLAALAHVAEVKPRRDHQRSFTACCPAHDDSRPSLSVDLARKGNILIKCWAGCGASDVIEAVGFDWNRLLPDDPNYLDRRERAKPEFSEQRLHLAIAHSSRQSGYRQTQQEKDEELAAFIAVRAKHYGR